MVLKPAARSLAFGCPGLFLTLLFVVFGVQEMLTGGVGTALVLLALNLIFIAMWLPFLVRFLGTRLVVDDHRLELSQLFGLKRRQIARSEIREITVERGNVGESEGGLGESYAGIPVAYYDIVDRKGRRWKRLSTWFWRGADCQRLVADVNGSWSNRPAAQAKPAAAEGFAGTLQSVGCFMQGASTAFGFLIGALLVAAYFHVPMGRGLGAAAVPAAIAGGVIGSSANLSGAVYRFLTTHIEIAPGAAKALAIVWMLAVPVALWVVVLVVLTVILTIVAPATGA